MKPLSRLLTPPVRYLPLTSGPFPSSTSSSICNDCARRIQRIQSPTISNSESRRSYATESSLSTSTRPANESDLAWPTTNPNNPYEIPTPYQIFRMSRKEQYSKKRFYELVKLYHPDRHQVNQSTSTPLSPTTKLQRYRMVIAANELLSDPRRRRLYDSQGIGWSGRPEFGPTKPRWEYSNHPRTGFSGFEGNDMRNDPRANATWEDWEAWQMRQDRTRGEQRPTYMNNGSFVVVICVAAGIAASFEGQRAGVESRATREQVEVRHAMSSEEMNKRRLESRSDHRDERLRSFLRTRGRQEGEIEVPAVGQEREGSLFVPDEEIGTQTGR